MKEIKCPCCHKDIITTNGVKDKDRGMNYIGWGAIIAGGPIGMAAGAATLLSKAGKKHLLKEVDIRCPHCKQKITLTKEQWKEIKKLVKELQTEERHKKQNRL